MTPLNRREFMQASATSFLLDMVKVPPPQNSSSGPENTAKAFVRANVEAKSWTVGNGLVEREVHLDPAEGLYTASWRHKVTGTDFMEEGRKRGSLGGEFSVQVDGDSLVGSEGSAWELVEASSLALSPSGQALAIHVRARAKPLDVTIFYAAYEGHAAIRKWIAITNRGTAPMTLSHLSFESVSLAPGPPDVLQASAFYGAEPRELFLTDESMILPS